MKKLRTCKALYGHDKKTARPGGVFAHSASYLVRSADIIRSGVSLRIDVSDLNTDSSTPVDSVVRIAQRAAGPVFLRVGYLDSASERFRRLGYGIYSDDFYNEVARHAMGHQGLVQKVQGEMGNLRKNGLAALRPKFIEVWEAIMRDIPPTLGKIIRNLPQLCHGCGEFEIATVGCAAKPTLPIVGHVGRKKKKFLKKSQAVPRPDQLRAVNIARGACGSILLAAPLFPESVVASALVYKDKLTDEQRGSVKFSALLQ